MDWLVDAGKDKNAVQMSQAVKDKKARNNVTNGNATLDTGGSDGMTTLV